MVMSFEFLVYNQSLGAQHTIGTLRFTERQRDGNVLRQTVN